MSVKEATLYTDTLIKIDNFLPEIDNKAVIDSIYSDLTSTPKSISSIYFYDVIGSKLFEEITRLPEYYLTRTERVLLNKISMDIGEKLRDVDIVEFGSGDCSKISILLDAIPEYQMESIHYIPVDVSEPVIEESAGILVNKFPGLSIHGVVVDFLKQLPLISNGNKRLFCFLGSTLGNLTQRESLRFFSNLGEIMKPGDMFLLGVDMVKPKDILERAYNDSQNVTAEFNRNILNVINNLTGANFNTNTFKHVAFFNEQDSRIEMHLQAKYDMEITSPKFPQNIIIEKDEMIHTENSHKYTLEALQNLAKASGLMIENTISDNNNWFSLHQLYKKI